MIDSSQQGLEILQLHVCVGRDGKEETIFIQKFASNIMYTREKNIRTKTSSYQ